MSTFSFIYVYINENAEENCTLHKEDIQQITAFIQGEKKAASYFFSVYNGPLYNFILRYCGYQEQLATDLVQDSFVKLLQSRKKLKPERGIRNYLYTIAVNLCKDHFRRSKYNDSTSMDSLQEKGHEAAVDDFNVETNIELQEMKIFLEKCIDNLPEREKTVVLLRKVNGLSYGEIAKINNCSQKTIQRTMNSAIDKIMVLFKEAGFAENGVIKW